MAARLQTSISGTFVSRTGVTVSILLWPSLPTSQSKYIVAALCLALSFFSTLDDAATDSDTAESPVDAQYRNNAIQTSDASSSMPTTSPLAAHLANDDDTSSLVARSTDTDLTPPPFFPEVPPQRPGRVWQAISRLVPSKLY